MDLGPGVFIEEVKLPRSIDGVATSTAAFLGHATAGPLDRAVLVTSFVEYERTFGGMADLRSLHAAHPDEVPDVDHLGHAVLAFFANGGRRAYVRRLSTDTRDAVPLRDPAAFRAALDDIDADPDAGQASVILTPGLAWDAAGARPSRSSPATASGRGGGSRSSTCPRTRAAGAWAAPADRACPRPRSRRPTTRGWS